MNCSKLLGDRVEEALTKVGITSEGVSQWLGRPCGCEERKLRLNQLHVWANRVLYGRLEQAKEYLKQILNQ